jgi:hypothetical protein
MRRSLGQQVAQLVIGAALDRNIGPLTSFIVGLWPTEVRQDAIAQELGDMSANRVIVSASSSSPIRK